MAGKVVTRFAPSPTGFMHVGSVRTALYAWLWAKKNNGTFILRIEDTDKDREVEGSAEHISESLRWLGLTPDQGPIFQSKRLDVYKKYADGLREAGHAYPDGEALRFKIPVKKRYHWHDQVYGDLTAGEEALEDFIILKSDGYPTYNFAHIVDDIEMGVTHVMRGEEFISSTPKYLSLYEALGTTPPFFVTLPLILGPSGQKKLSKRDGAKDLLDYRDEGYLHDAFINFLALLGWNPGTEQEIFSREELKQAFDISRIQKSGAQISQEKLDWINKEHMKKLPSGEVRDNILIRLPPELQNEKLIPIIFERISKWGDTAGMLGAGELDFFLRRPEVDKKKLAYKNTPSERIEKNLKLAAEALKNISENNFTRDSVKNALDLISANLETRGELLHPVRYALTGRSSSPDPFIISEVLGKNETIARLESAI